MCKHTLYITFISVYMYVCMYEHNNTTESVTRIECVHSLSFFQTESNKAAIQSGISDTITF